MSHTQALHDLGTMASQPSLSLHGSRQQGCRRSRASVIGPRSLLLAAAFMLPVFVGLMACAQALLSPGPSLGAEAFWSAPSLPNGRAIVYGPTNSPSILGLAGLVDVVPSQTPAQLARDFPHRPFEPGVVPGRSPWPKRPSWPGHPPPGVYKTAPYTCIVVVPGPNADDKCIVGGEVRDKRMPTLEPPLVFIPRTRR